jgi:hypothetical protein
MGSPLTDDDDVYDLHGGEIERVIMFEPLFCVRGTADGAKVFGPVAWGDSICDTDQLDENGGWSSCTVDAENDRRWSKALDERVAEIRTVINTIRTGSIATWSTDKPTVFYGARLAELVAPFFIEEEK